VLVVTIAGCSGVFGGVSETPSDVHEQRFRLVIQNEAPSPQTVGLTLTSNHGRIVLDESKTLQTGGGWVVSTFNVSSLVTPVKITIHLPQRNESQELSPIRSTTRGSRLHVITGNGINLYECNRNVTCWQQFP
jgi:hypothetical protein